MKTKLFVACLMFATMTLGIETKSVSVAESVEGSSLSQTQGGQPNSAKEFSLWLQRSMKDIGLPPNQDKAFGNEEKNIVDNTVILPDNVDENKDEDDDVSDDVSVDGDVIDEMTGEIPEWRTKRDAPVRTRRSPRHNSRGGRSSRGRGRGHSHSRGSRSHSQSRSNSRSYDTDGYPYYGNPYDRDFRYGTVRVRYHGRPYTYDNTHGRYGYIYSYGYGDNNSRDVDGYYGTTNSRDRDNGYGGYFTNSRDRDSRGRRSRSRDRDGSYEQQQQQQPRWRRWWPRR